MRDLANHLVTASLAYLMIGSLVWMLLDGLGIVRNSFEARLARGRPVSFLRGALATAAAILAWPMIVYVFLRGRVRAILKSTRPSEELASAEGQPDAQCCSPSAAASGPKLLPIAFAIDLDGMADLITDRQTELTVWTLLLALMLALLLAGAVFSQLRRAPVERVTRKQAGR
jgi:hypothetical protein